MFNFKRLINKYSKIPAYELRETDGYKDYDKGGIYIPGKIEKILIDGAVVPLSKQELEYGEGGSYSVGDRKLYCYVDFVKGTKIEHKELAYTIQEKLDYADFDNDLRIYFIKRGGK